MEQLKIIDITLNKLKYRNPNRRIGASCIGKASILLRAARHRTPALPIWMMLFGIFVHAVLLLWVLLLLNDFYQIYQLVF